MQKPFLQTGQARFQSLDRRRWAIGIGSGLLAISGCDRTAEVAGNLEQAVDDTAEQIVSDLESETLEQTKAVLYGFMITSFFVGASLRFLPVPAVRILGLALIISDKGAALAIHYLSEELDRRKHLEPLEPPEVEALETAGEVRFQLDNGQHESLPLGPREYR